MRSRRALNASRAAAAICAIATAVVASMWASCSRGSSGPEVVLYSSMDGEVLEPILERFTRETGVRVLLVGDTEATKTTGLVQRIIAEREKPRADVFWSSEPLGVVSLERKGLLSPGRSEAAEGRIAGGWPAEMKAGDFSWYALAPRVRVVVSNTQAMGNVGLTNLGSLAEERFKGRVGMARPQFGTTRAHMAALLAYCGEMEYRSWLVGLRENGVRLYDGNAAVVRAVARGEAHLGLTDSDDVFAAQRNGWPVELHAVFSHVTAWHYAMPTPKEFPYGAMRIPGTVAVIKGGPSPGAAARLRDFILSEAVEGELARSVWRSLRVSAAAGEDDQLAARSQAVDLEKLAAHEARALAIFEEVFAGGDGK